MTDKEIHELEKLPSSELRFHISDVSSSINALKDKRDAIQKILADRKEEAEAAKHAEYIGKCFQLCASPAYINTGVIPVTTFRIVRILPPPNTAYAECIAINKDTQKGCWTETNIVRCVLPLWVPTQRIVTENTPKYIDAYSEIPKTVFSQMLREAYASITGEKE